MDVVSVLRFKKKSKLTQKQTVVVFLQGSKILLSNQQFVFFPSLWGVCV